MLVWVSVRCSLSHVKATRPNCSRTIHGEDRPEPSKFSQNSVVTRNKNSRTQTSIRNGQRWTFPYSPQTYLQEIASASVHTSSQTETEEVAIALAFLSTASDQKNVRVNTDSQSACRIYARGKVSSTAHRILASKAPKYLPKVTTFLESWTRLSSWQSAS